MAYDCSKHSRIWRNGADSRWRFVSLIGLQATPRVAMWINDGFRST
jgi:hypothetical protein